MHWYLVVVSHRLRNENVISVTSSSDKHIKSNTSLSVALATHVTLKNSLVLEISGNSQVAFYIQPSFIEFSSTMHTCLQVY